MNPNGRIGRTVWLCLATLSLALAGFSLMIALFTAEGESITKFLYAAVVFALGSIALTIAAGVWTLAANPASAAPTWPSHQMQQPSHSPPGYGGGAGQEAWIPPSDQAPGSAPLSGGPGLAPPPPPR